MVVVGRSSDRRCRRSLAAEMSRGEERQAREGEIAGERKEKQEREREGRRNNGSLPPEFTPAGSGGDWLKKKEEGEMREMSVGSLVI